MLRFHLIPPLTLPYLLIPLTSPHLFTSLLPPCISPHHPSPLITSLYVPSPPPTSLHLFAPLHTSLHSSHFSSPLCVSPSWSELQNGGKRAVRAAQIRAGWGNLSLPGLRLISSLYSEGSPSPLSRIGKVPLTSYREGEGPPHL